MRIKSCYINSFGALHERRIQDLDNGMVVILGPNEAGKSTFFHFLTTMLFGFSPADALKHPYASESGSPSGTIQFVASRTACTVERSLKSTPRGRLIVGEDGLFRREENLRNRPLPQLASASRELFEAVYALTLADMVRIEGKAWETIQDRLLGGLNIEQIRSPRQVAAEIETEAKRLWRPDRRGKARSADIREQVRTLRAKVREARDRDRLIRQTSEEVAQMRVEMKVLEHRLAHDSAMVRTADRLIPVKQGLESIARLEEKAGDLSVFSAIPNDPASRRNHLRSAVNTVKRDLALQEDKLQRLRGQADRFDHHARCIFDRRVEIRKWQSNLALIVQRRVGLEQALERLESIKLEAERMVFDLTGTRDQRVLDVVRSIPLHKVQSKLSDLRSMSSRLADFEARAGLPSGSSRGGFKALPILLSILGAVGTVAGLALDQPVVWGPAVVLAAVCGTLVFLSVLESRRKESDMVAAEVAAARRELARTRSDLEGLLGAMHLPEDRWQSGDAGLADDLAALQSLATRIATDEKFVARTEELLNSDAREVASLAAGVGVQSDNQTVETINRLVRRLEEAEALQAAAGHASIQTETEVAVLENLRVRSKEMSEELESLEAVLSQMGDGDADRGIDVVEERRSLVRRASAIRTELESRFPDLSELIDEVSTMNGSVALTDEAREELGTRIEEAHARLNELTKQIAARESQIQSLEREPSVSDIESQIELLEEEAIRVGRERDRLMLLAGLIREADSVFREKHQPDVLRRASAMLSTLTSRRYDRLELNEDTDRIVVHDTYSGRRLTVSPPLSRGTLDQIYLTIRLAIAEHLDDPDDPLPLFLDEVLVNWDESRRQAAMNLFRDLSEHRQLFFFTCHEWLADELKRFAGAHVVDL